MDGQFIGKVLAFGHFYRVDVAEQVGHRNVRCRQLFGVPFFPSQPDDFRFVAVRRHHVAAVFTNRGKRVVVDFAALNRRYFFIQQLHQDPHQTRLCLSAFTEENHIVPGKDGIFDIGNNCVAVTDNPRKYFAVRLHHFDEIAS